MKVTPLLLLCITLVYAEKIKPILTRDNFDLPSSRVERQVTYLGGFGGKGIPGIAGLDYPVLASVPTTSFSCPNDFRFGYYADVAAGCQVFHICQDGHQVSLLCPNGTIFNQKLFICDWYFKVDCAQSPQFFNLNFKINDFFGGPVSGNNQGFFSSGFFSSDQSGQGPGGFLI